MITDTAAIRTARLELENARVDLARAVARSTAGVARTYREVEAAEHLRDLAVANVSRAVRAANPGVTEAELNAATRALPAEVDERDTTVEVGTGQLMVALPGEQLDLLAL